MTKKRLFNSRGLTLIELILTLAIFGIIVMVAFPILTFTSRTSNTQLKESSQRNEVRILSSYLKSDIEYSKELTVFDRYSLRVINSKDEIINYNIQTDTAGNSFLVRQNGSTTEFKDIPDVEFKVLNDHLVQAKLITDVAANKFTEFKIFRWDMIVQRPGDEDDINDIIIRDKVLVLGNKIDIDGGSTVSGSDATVIVRNNLFLSGSNVQYIATKNIYIDGNVTLDRGAGIGKTDNTSSIYIKGNCIVSGTGKLFGNSIIAGNFTVDSPKLSGNIYVNGDFRVSGGSYSEFLKMPVHIYYTGSLFLPKGFGSIQATKVDTVEDIIFPSITVPPLQTPDWYAERGYTSDSTSRSDMKYFGNSYTFKYNNGNTFNNVIIASKINITISGDKHVTGILFAPNGEVIISRGSSFEGIIIAKKTTVSGDSHVTFHTPNIDDLPF